MLTTTMTNKELQQILKQYPEDANIILEGYQDEYLDPYSSSLAEVTYDQTNKLIQLFPTEDTLDQIPPNQKQTNPDNDQYNNPVPNRGNPSREPTPKTKHRQIRTQVQMALLDNLPNPTNKRTITHLPQTNKQNNIIQMAYNITIHNIL